MSDDRDLTLEDLADLYIESLRTDAEARLATYGLECAPRVGDVWATRGARRQDLPAVVVITHVEIDVLRAVVVMQEPSLSAADDVLVSGEQSPTGTPLVLCAWRDVPVVIDDLDTFLGSLPDSVVEPLVMVLQQRVSGGFARTPLGATHLSSGERALRWLVEPEDRRAGGCEYLTGAQILSATDPRLRVRQEILLQTRYLERDVMQQLASDLSVIGVTQENVTGPSETRLASRFPSLAESGRLAEISRWRKATDAMPRVFPRAA